MTRTTRWRQDGSHYAAAVPRAIRRKSAVSNSPNIAVIYYSATGTVYELAQLILTGAEDAGAEVRLLKVAELAPKAAIDANPAWQANAAATQHVPTATSDDVRWADAVILGSPTRFGNVASQLKQFLDTLGGLWARGELADKVYSGFTASTTAHGGQESTLLALYNSVHHFGGILVAPGYTDPIKYDDGNPYGTSHVSGQGPVDDTIRAAAAYQGRRVAVITGALKAPTVADRAAPPTVEPTPMDVR
jgi:NAD(P)H dehydrogenase (quinone)